MSKNGTKNGKPLKKARSQMEVVRTYLVVVQVAVAITTLIVVIIR